MPIPNDSEKREWVDASNNNPGFVDVFRPCLIAFVAFDVAHVPCIAGSGFIVGHSEEFALALTAKHVLEGAASMQRPHRPYAPSALFIPPSATRPSIDEAKLRAIWMGEQSADLLCTRHIAYNDTLDAACAVFEPQVDFVAGFTPASIPLDAREPKIGDVVHMVSLDQLEISNYSPPTDISGAGFTFSIGRRVCIRVGTVTGVYPKGFRQYKWPCFTTSIPAEAGMSGGMVYVVRENEPTSICGIVSADNSLEESRTNNAIAGESVVALVWPALCLPVPTLAANDSPMLSLHEMMSSGKMHPAFSIENIDYIDRGDGEGLIVNKIG